MLTSIQTSCRVSCGYAAIMDVTDHSRGNLMQSFFLAELTKYVFTVIVETMAISDMALVLPMGFVHANLPMVL